MSALHPGGEGQVTCSGSGVSVRRESVLVRNHLKPDVEVPSWDVNAAAVSAANFLPRRSSRGIAGQSVTCSAPVRNSLNRESKKRLWWTVEEVDELKCVANFGPLSYVSERFNQWAASNGYEKRSQNAIAQKLYKMGFRQESLEYICLSLLARRLGSASHRHQVASNRTENRSRLRRKKKVTPVTDTFLDSP